MLQIGGPFARLIADMGSTWLLPTTGFVPHRVSMSGWASGKRFHAPLKSVVGGTIRSHCQKEGRELCGGPCYGSRNLSVVTVPACLIAAYLCVPDIWSGLTDEQRDKLEPGNEAMAALHRLGHGASQEAFVIQCDRSGASSTFAPRRRAVSFQPSAVCRSASMVMFFASSKSSRCCTRSVVMSA